MGDVQVATPLTRLAAFADLSRDDLAHLLTMAGPKRQFGRGDQLFHEGDFNRTLYLLIDGWTASSITVPSGGRQMLRIQLPGDMIGLPSLALTRIPDTVTALTPVTVCKVAMRTLGQLFQRSPRLGALLFLVSQDERVMLMDRLTALGRLSASGRLAGLLLQILDRVARHDPATSNTIHMPLTQEDLSDLIGTSHVHLSRSMAKLRRNGLIAYDRRSVTIIDKDALRSLAGMPERSLNTNQDWLPRSE